MAEKKKQLTTTASPERRSPRLRRSTNARRIQNFLVVWLDAGIDEVKNEDYRNTIRKLNRIVKDVNTFTDIDDCVDFIKSVKEEKAFLISSGAFGQEIVTAVHDMSQVSTIYIFCGNQARHERWAKEWPKIGGVFTDIKPICETLKRATKACDQNSIAISLVARTSGQCLDQLDPTFMYTQMLKEIILTIDFGESHIKDFIKSSRKLLAGATKELDDVDLIEREYAQHLPIWWYTYESFLYPTLNRALRLMEVDLIVSMGFFVRDLHENIAELHKKQFGEHASSAAFTVYRGQVLAKTAFNQIIKTKGGLLSFNNFLSTSTNREVSLSFAQKTLKTTDLVVVLFVLKIDPSITSTPFANVCNVSWQCDEDEILFSMHSIFRIGGIKKIDGSDPFWEVGLSLTSDNDPQLRVLTTHIRQETAGSTGWDRLGKLMIKLGQFNQAEGLYETLMEQATTERERASIFYHLGWTKYGQGKYAEAITLYERSIKIKEKVLAPTDPDLASSYNNIGAVYDEMGKHSKALSFYEKALEIERKTLPPDHSSLAASYSNTGAVYQGKGEYSKALSYFEKALDIRKKTLPSNHPDVATSYNNIGGLYDEMEEHSKALSYHEKALAIREKTLPSNHPDLAQSYNNSGTVYMKMGEHSKALDYYKKALAIREKTLPSNHPSLAVSYNNMAGLYDTMGEYAKALSYYEKTLKIEEETLPPNHPSLASSYNNLGVLYYNMKKYSKALSFLERALDIERRVLPADHPDLRNTKESIEAVKQKL